MQSNKDNKATFKGRGMIWAGNSCHRPRSMKKEYGNFPFSHEIILKQNYIVILAIRFIQPRPPALSLLYVAGPSGSASVHEISATKHVAWFTYSLLLRRQLLWSEVDGRKIQLVSPTLFISFSYNKEPLMSKRS